MHTDILKRSCRLKCINLRNSSIYPSFSHFWTMSMIQLPSFSYFTHFQIYLRLIYFIWIRNNQKIFFLITRSKRNLYMFILIISNNYNPNWTLLLLKRILVHSKCQCSDLRSYHRINTEMSHAFCILPNIMISNKQKSRFWSPVQSVVRTFLYYTYYS